MLQSDNKRGLTIPSLRNGRYQHIFSLGVAGHVIVNHADREIILIDPWPSYEWGKFDVFSGKNDKRGMKRLEALVNFLRESVGEGYRLVGILLSHNHFDHIDDIRRLYSLLCREEGRRRIDRGEFRITGPRLAENQLPPAHCDRDTIESLFDRPVPGCHPSSFEITLGGRSLRYDDGYNRGLPKKERCTAGVPADPFDIGHFRVEPYVWDHWNVGDNTAEARLFTSGGLQRQTAFVIYRRRSEQTKRTFVSGSAGEMHREFTGEGLVRELRPRLSVDVLITAITDAGKSLDAMVAYQKRNLNVRDTIICSHFDDFLAIRRGPSSTKEFVDARKGGDFRRVRDYLEALTRVSPQRVRADTALVDKVRVLSRRGFECDYPHSAGAFEVE